ncbi:hypothetical protein GPL15_20965 [Clostridium sp. MCC353]|uniref:aldose epimerase family protein n=1 Tax=Clostridium sp. MCC353 TaxID=2592646 RepID=UPI001C00D2A8|nr:hypothetical protein [Clostridium sp. MCC353]MBT9778951.1 hypothetical protein [Clostridium sp. MCC353]
MHEIETYRILEQEKLVLESSDGGLRAAILPARGGMLVSLKKDGEEFIYCDPDNLLSEDRPKCGMPVLFPVCGKLKEDVCPIDGTLYPMPMHGLAQKEVWEILDTGWGQNGAYLRLRFTSDAFTERSFPYQFCVELEYRIKGDQLYVFQTYKNQSEKPMYFSFGFHPYFYISSLQQTEFRLHAREIWIPSEQSRNPAPERFLFPWKGIREYGAMMSGCKESVSFLDKGNGHMVEVAFSQEFPYALLWSRPEKHFVCLEPWSAPADAFHIAPDTLTCLGAGESLNAEISIRIDISDEEKRRR